jgi:hypothetical protein
MTAIPATGDTTIAAVFAAIERDADKQRRAHLGASILGRECRRALWYAFRWSDEQPTGGRIYRMFRRGLLEEEQFVADLRAAGLTVHDRDETGQQFRFLDVGGHVGGSMDGCAVGLKEAPKTWHVLEFKTHSNKSFSDLQRNGVQKSKPEHYAQMQLYMHWSGMDRAYYLSVNKDNDDLYGERVHYDKDAAEKLIARANAIVTASEPLERISEKADYYLCRFCSARTVCHEKRIPAPSCRTCVHATPELLPLPEGQTLKWADHDNGRHLGLYEWGQWVKWVPQDAHWLGIAAALESGTGTGRWSCAYHKRDVTLDEQRKGCEHHVYIPALVPLEFVGGDEAGNFAEYKRPGGGTLRNGSGDANVHTSEELHAAQADLTVLDDQTLAYLRINLGGRLEAVRPAPPQNFDDWEQVKAALPLASERVHIPASEVPF